MFFKKIIIYALLYCLFSQSLVTAMGHIAPWIAAEELIFDYARKQDVNGVKRCLDRGVSVNAKRNGSTVLHVALSRQIPEQTPADDDMVALLLERKADVNAQDRLLDTPMHCAASHNRVRALALLKEAHGDLNAQNHRGSTPCQTAVIRNSLEAIIWLGNAGADMNLFDHRGQTPLHDAVYYKKPSAVDLLLRHRAQLIAKTEINNIANAPESTIVPAGSTVFHLAARAATENRLQIQRILLYHGLLHPEGTPILPKALVTFWCCLKQEHPDKVSILKQVLMPYLMQSLPPTTLVQFLASPKARECTATRRLLQQRLDFVKALVAAEDVNGNTAYQIEINAKVQNRDICSYTLLLEDLYDIQLQSFVSHAQVNAIANLYDSNIFKAAYSVARELNEPPAHTIASPLKTDTTWIQSIVQQCGIL